MVVNTIEIHEDSLLVVAFPGRWHEDSHHQQAPAPTPAQAVEKYDGPGGTSLVTSSSSTSPAATEAVGSHPVATHVWVLRNMTTFPTLEELTSSVMTMSKLPADIPIHFLHSGKVVQGASALAALADVDTETLVLTARKTITPIPGPTPIPLFGNVLQLLPDHLQSFLSFFKEFGPVVSINFAATQAVSTNSAENAEFLAKDTGADGFFSKRFLPSMSEHEIKRAGGDGLFTSSTDDPMWILGHKLLMPAFSPKALRPYAKTMSEIAGELMDVVTVFADRGLTVNFVPWLNNATFEAIGRIGFGYSFHLLRMNQEGSGEAVAVAPTHPVLAGLSFLLQETRKRMLRPGFATQFYFETNKKFDEQMKLIRHTIEMSIAEQRKQGSHADTNLLDFMLGTQDETNSKMPDSVIIDQVITFLIAGHETTSATLSWCLYLLHQNPTAWEDCRQEVDQLEWGTKPITATEVGELVILDRVIKETLRLFPPVAGVSKVCLKDCILPTGHAIKAGTNVRININAVNHNPNLHAHPKVFDLDRWLPENESKRSPYSWIPFSFGARGCIGRQFAIMELKIVMATLVRRFNWVIPSCDKVQYDPFQPTTRPMYLPVIFSKRRGHGLQVSPSPLVSRASTFAQPTATATSTATATPTATTATATATATGTMATGAEKKANPKNPSSTVTEKKIAASVAKSGGDPTSASRLPTVGSRKRVPVVIAYGSNTGTSQDCAQTLASALKLLEFQVSLFPLDDWSFTREGKYTPLAGKLEGKENNDESSSSFHELVFIVTATYNGQPPENATYFDTVISEKNSLIAKSGRGKKVLEGVGFSVFGCGNSEWRTYQVFPAKIVTAFTELGADLFCPRGAGNASGGGNIESDFNEWMSLVIENVIHYFGIKVSEDTFTEGRAQVETVVSMVAATDSAEDCHLAGPPNAEIVSNVELLKDSASTDARSTRLLTIKLHEDVTYLPGDHLEVVPLQDPQLVARTAKALSWNLSDVFVVKSVGDSASNRSVLATLSGRKCTVSQMLERFADLTRPPTPALVRLVQSLMVKKSIESGRSKGTRASLIDRMESLSISYDRDRDRDRSSPSTTPRSSIQSRPLSQTDDSFPVVGKTLVDFLEFYAPKFKEKMTLNDFMTAVPTLIPRRYSIASAPADGVLSKICVVNLLVSVVSDGRGWYGLASGYLKRLKPTASIHVQVRSCKDTFRPPTDLSVPFLMIAAGTGIAPFMGFLQDRDIRKRKENVQKTGEVYLIYGCRGPKEVLCNDLLDDYVRSQTLTQISLAFSRPQGTSLTSGPSTRAATGWQEKETSSKKYVQDILREQKELVWKLLQQKGKIYVCGSASNGMVKQIRQTVGKIAEDMAGKDKFNGDNFLEHLIQEKQYVEDVWG